MITIQGKSHTFSFEPLYQTLVFSGDGGFIAKVSEVFQFSILRPWELAPIDGAFSATREGNTLILTLDNFWKISCRFHFEDDLLLADCTWSSNFANENALVAIVLPCEEHAVLTMPGSLYSGNPSWDGKRLMPRLPEAEGDAVLLEESRYPIPAVSAGSKGCHLALFSIPSQDLQDEWTLGALCHEKKQNLLLTSGAFAFPGQKDQLLSGKGVLSPEEGYRSVQKGTVLHKQFAVAWGKQFPTGQEFRILPALATQIYQPQVKPRFSLEEMLELKTQALDGRWFQDGFLDAMPGNVYNYVPVYLYGWTGQSLRLAFCDLRLAALRQEPWRKERAFHCVDFFLKNSPEPVPGLRYNYCNPANGTWSANSAEQRVAFSARALGETWTDLGRILLYCREQGIETPREWTDAMERAMKFVISHKLENGLPPMFWSDKGLPITRIASSAGSTFLPALLAFWKLDGKAKWLAAAEKMTAAFWEFGGGHFEHPFSHATLDSACEDKEAGIPFFRAAAWLWRETGKGCYHEWAEATADWLLTWLYFWDTPFQSDSVLAKNDFHSTGWSCVSVENQHLDVFFPCYEIHAFGKASGDARLERLGKLAFQAWGASISTGKGNWMYDTPGCQGEQFFQSRWTFPLAASFRHYPEHFRKAFAEYGIGDENWDEKLRQGGFNPWDTSWIIALVLDDAIAFQMEQKS